MNHLYIIDDGEYYPNSVYEVRGRRIYFLESSEGEQLEITEDELQRRADREQTISGERMTNRPTEDPPYISLYKSTWSDLVTAYLWMKYWFIDLLER